MNLEPVPRFKKIPFVAAAAVCVTAVILIGLFAENKFAPLPFLSSVGLLLTSVVAFMIPVLADYAAESAEYVQRERLKTEEQVQRLQGAAESLARAAAQIKAVEEAVHKTAHAAETLPYRMQEKLVEFNTALAEREDGDREALEEELVELRAANSGQLKALAEKIQKNAADWTALESSARKQLAAIESAAGKAQQSGADLAAGLESKLNAALAALDARLARMEIPPHPPAPRPASAPAAETAPKTVAAETAPPDAENQAAEHPTAPDDSKARKSRVIRKATPDEPAAAAPRPASVEKSAQPKAHEPAPDTPPSIHDDMFPPEAAHAAFSSDGATRLLATAYIGIGNKLFIRGDGPGLSWDKGVPMQFVSIGKWGWATSDATAPVRCELYKNDESAALTGEVVIHPGKHVEMTALF